MKKGFSASYFIGKLRNYASLSNIRNYFPVISLNIKDLVVQFWIRVSGTYHIPLSEGRVSDMVNPV